MSYDYDNTAVFASIWAFFGILILFELVIIAAAYVVMGFALMSFFRKVGVEPWIAWVPIYNHWKWLEVAGFPGAIALAALVPYGGIVSSVFLYIGMYRTGLAFGKEPAFVLLGIFLPFVWAFMLGGSAEVYRPEVLAQHGYPPPRAGFGSVPPAQYPPSAPPPAAA
jgi:hypothetical protein